MSVDIAKLLLNSRYVLDEECASKAVELVLDDETRMVDGAPAIESAGQLLSTLRARKVNSARIGKKILGLDRIVAKLEQTNPLVPIAGYGFISPRAAGSIYVTGGSGELLGATIVDREVT